MPQKNYFYKQVLAMVLLSLSYNCSSQVLLISTPDTEDSLGSVKKIIFEQLHMPEKIFSERFQKDCKVNVADQQSYDLVMCIKKNGKLEFPVYKKNILKNSYQKFF